MLSITWLLDFYCLTYFVKSIDMWWMVSLWCEILCNVSMYNLKCDQWTLNNKMVNKTGVGISITYIHFLQFKIKSYLQKWRLWMPVHQNSFRRKTSKLSNIIFAILHCENVFTKLPAWVLWNVLFLMKPSDTFQDCLF